MELAPPRIDQLHASSVTAEVDDDAVICSCAARHRSQCIADVPERGAWTGTLAGRGCESPDARCRDAQAVNQYTLDLIDIVHAAEQRLRLLGRHAVSLHDTTKLEAAGANLIVRNAHRQVPRIVGQGPTRCSVGVSEGCVADGCRLLLCGQMARGSWGYVDLVVVVADNDSRPRPRRSTAVLSCGDLRCCGAAASAKSRVVRSALPLVPLLAVPLVARAFAGVGDVHTARRPGRALRHRLPAGGTSVIESSPYADRFHPTLKSQVSAGATVRIAGGGIPSFQEVSFQPSNHHADENGSMPPNRGSIGSPWRRAFWST